MLSQIRQIIRSKIYLVDEFGGQDAVDIQSGEDVLQQLYSLHDSGPCVRRVNGVVWLAMAEFVAVEDGRAVGNLLAGHFPLLRGVGMHKWRGGDALGVSETGGEANFCRKSFGDDVVVVQQKKKAWRLVK